MQERNSGRQDSLKVVPNSNPSYVSSRRNFIAGAAFVGAFVASTTVGARSAMASWDIWNNWGYRPRKRPKRRGPIRHRWGRRDTGGGGSGGGGSGGGGTHCFLKDTLILGPDGERRIETLQIGDLVETASSEMRPIKWIGRSTVERQENGGWKTEHVPVKVSRGALNGTLPSQDLYVTDSHCFLINGLLIRAIDLVNGTTISKAAPASRDQLDYYHIELADHDVIIANGAPAETLRAEAGERQNFDNFDEYVRLYGPEPATVPACAPLVANKNLIQELQSRSRSVVAPVWDRRRPLEIIRDALADRAYREAA